MYNFKFIDFDQNLNQCVAADFCTGSTLFLAPSKASARDLKKIYQQRETFNNSAILAMEDFKLRCLQVDTAILKEEKRTLAFYAAIREYRTEFHCENYFQSVKLAYDFFTFWDELAEELITIEAVRNTINQKETAENWQMETFNLFLLLKDAYYNAITARNFTDLIFLKQPKNVSTEWLDEYEQIVVINQFYFTEFEKLLLPEDGTYIYLQLPESIYDKTNLTCKLDFHASHLFPKRTEVLYNHLFTDELSLRQSLFTDLLSNPPDLIIDFGMLQNHLEKYNCRHLLSGISFDRFFSSSLFQYYEHFQTLLSSIIPLDNDFLLPLNSLIKAFTDIKFYSPYFKNCLHAANESEISLQSEKTISYIYLLAEREYKYIELKGKLPQNPDSDIQSVFDHLNILLDEFFGLGSARDLVKTLYSSTCIPVQDILTLKELQFTDLRDSWDNLLTDFASLDEIGFLSSWEDIFPLNNSHKYARGAQFLRLFLEFAKTKSYHISTRSDQAVPLATLHNTRNIQYDTIYVADTIEGVLPPSRQTPFLLTECQRNELGLKTFEDIQLREKYYFYRLVAQAKKVHCYSRSSQKERTEVSSFLEELKIAFPDLYQQDKKPSDVSPQNLGSTWLGAAEPGRANPEIPSDFFVLPFNSDSDLRDGKFFLSPSSVQNLIDNPFMHYLSGMLYLRKRELELQMDFSPLLIGNLVHEAFDIVWQEIIRDNPATLEPQQIDYNKEKYANSALAYLRQNNRQTRLQKPHNYSVLYFERVVIPFIIDAIKKFLNICAEKYADQAVIILPEISQDQSPLELFRIDSIPVLLKGRADLRIEIPSTNEKHIYDYKSGKSKSASGSLYNTQLICYEHFYYHWQEGVKSWLYFVTEQKMVSRDLRRMSAEEYWQQTTAKIKGSLEKVFIIGYELGEKTAYDEDDNLTRRTLLMQQRNSHHA